MKIGTLVRVIAGVVAGVLLVTLGVNMARHKGSEMDGLMMIFLGIAIVHTTLVKPRPPKGHLGR